MAFNVASNTEERKETRQQVDQNSMKVFDSEAVAFKQAHQMHMEIEKNQNMHQLHPNVNIIHDL